MAKARKARTENYSVVIAGGGFAGGTLALASQNLRVALIDEASPQLAPAKRDARGLALSAATKSLLDAVGLWTTLLPNVQAIESIEITDSPLNARLRPHVLGFDTELSPDTPSAYLVEAGDVLRAISDAIAAETAIDVFAPDGIDGSETDAFGVHAHLASGETLHAPLLVGADGKRSRVRERAGIKCIGWSYPQSGIVVNVTHERPHNGKAVQHFLPAGPFAILPLKGDRSSIVWTEEKAIAKTLLEGDETTFVAALTRRFGHRLGAISLEGAPQSFPRAFQLARSFVGARLALIGDAAHVVHPLAGQGLNIGMRDVAALTETIVDALRLGLDIGNSVVLERYQRWRRFDGAFSATVMDGLNRLFSSDGDSLRAIRDLGMGIVDRSPALKRVLVRAAAGATGDVPRLLKGEGL
jgi:2-octaprenyl-6-methoxyphenol hydroxylase